MPECADAEEQMGAHKGGAAWTCSLDHGMVSGSSMCADCVPTQADKGGKSGASLVAQTVKNLPANAGDMGCIPDSGSSPRGGNATRSSTLVWEIPWTEEPFGLQSTGSHRTGLSK